MHPQRHLPASRLVLSELPKDYTFQLCFLGGTSREVTKTTASRHKAISQVLKDLLKSGEITKLATMQETRRVAKVVPLRTRRAATC